MYYIMAPYELLRFLPASASISDFGNVKHEENSMCDATFRSILSGFRMMECDTRWPSSVASAASSGVPSNMNASALSCHLAQRSSLHGSKTLAVRSPHSAGLYLSGVIESQDERREMK